MPPPQKRLTAEQSQQTLSALWGTRNSNAKQPRTETESESETNPTVSVARSADSYYDDVDERADCARDSVSAAASELVDPIFCYIHLSLCNRKNHTCHSLYNLYIFKKLPQTIKETDISHMYK